MEISIESYTHDPMDVIARAAGTCYGKADTSHKRVRTCFKSGHMSVFEHASVTFRVSGISRACSHQMVRHRLASYCQQSQRYCKVDTGTDWYVKPKSFEGVRSMYTDEPWDKTFDDIMHDIALDYQNAIAHGIKPEDARYMLPEACKTEIVCTMNVREIFHFLSMRVDKHAQWEIREMAKKLAGAICEIDEQWDEVIDLWITGESK